MTGQAATVSGGHFFVDNLVDEAGVGAVFQQAADEVCKKVTVRADWGIDAAAGGVVGEHDVVQAFAHAVQALEFKGQGIGRHVEDRGDGVGVVGGELGVDAVGHREEFAGAGDVGHVGGLLAGEDGKALQAKDLGALHLGIPVGAFHEADHDLAVQPGGQGVQPVDGGPGAAAVGLHHDAKAVPAFQRRVLKRGFDDFERKGQTVGLLGVDVEAQTGGAGEARQRTDAGDQFFHHAGAFRDFVARVEGGEFDRDAGVLADVVATGGGGNGGDRLGITEMVAAGVALGAGGFAQHVIAVGVAFGLKVFGAGHGFFDGLAQDEIAAHFLHRAGNGRADHRLAQPFHGGAQVAGDAAFSIVKHLAGEHQRPGGGVDEAGGGAAKVAAPVGGGDLVFDQRVHGFRVGHPKEGLGEAHQRDAFVGGQAVFGEEYLHQTRLRAGADAADEVGPGGGDAGAGSGIEGGLGDQAVDQGRLVGKAAGGDDGPGSVGIFAHGRLPLWVRIHRYGRAVFPIDWWYAGEVAEFEGESMVNDRSVLDRFDLAILRVLQTEGRIPAVALARRIGLSKSPAQARMKRLEEQGVITGYRAILDPIKMGQAHVAFVEVRLSDTREAALQAFNKAVLAVPEVEQCHMMASSFDYLLKVRTADIQAYRRVLGETISALPHVASTSTYVAMEAVKEVF